MILFPCRLYAENATANETTLAGEAAEPAPTRDKPSIGTKPPQKTETAQSSLMSIEGSGSGNFLSMPALATSLFTGAATIGIPIETPPGRLNLAPNLALNYNSYGGNGWLGQGWNLDMGAIQHSTKYGLNLHPNDYVAIVNGSASELVSRGGSLYAAKIEGAFSKYEFISPTSGWIVTAKNGTKYYYGRTAASRQDFDNGQYIFKWCLDRVEDTNGNYLTVTYATKDQGEIYLERIDYTGNTSGLPTTNSVRFYLEDGRPDVPLMFTPNRQVKTAKRLKTIEIRGNSQMARAYTFEYVPNGSASTGRSLLKKVQMYGSNAILNGSGTVTSGTALPPTTIWSDEGRTYSITSESPFYTNDIYSWVSNHWAYGDFNGDGKQDIIYRSGLNSMKIKFSNGNGSFTDSSYLVYMNDIAQWGPAYLDYGDFNGDGKTDIIYRTNNNENRIQFSYGNGAFSFGASFSTPDLYAVDPRYWTYGDFDGDGKTDIIYHTTTAYTKKIKFSNVDQNGYHTFTDSTYVIYTNDAVDWGPTAWGYGDFNGDGKTDIIYHTNSPYFSRVKFSNGRNTTFTNGPLFYVWDTYGSTYSWGQYWSYGDFNGDGKTDVMYLSVNLPYAWRIKLSNGDGNFTDGQEFFTEDILKKYPEYEDDWAPLYWGTGDFNGDGKTDLIYATTMQPYVGEWRIRFSNGDGTVTDGSVISAGDLYGGYGTPPYWTYGDFDGDGKTDLNYLTTPNWRRVRLSRASLDLPLSVTNPIGGITEISYASSSTYQNTRMPFVLQTVSSMRIIDGIYTYPYTQYQYSGGLYDFPDRDFRGFSYVKQTNPDLTIVEQEFHQTNYLKGRSYETRFKNPSQTLLSKTTQTWVAWPANCPDNYCFVKQTVSRSENYDDVTVFSQEDATFDNANGNLLTKSVSGTGAEAVTTAFEYWNYGTWLWRTSKITTTGATTGKVRETTYDYQSGTGNLLWQEAWNNNGASPRVNMGYDSYGNLTSVTDARVPPSTTTTTYDTATRTYPAVITYPTTTPNGVTHVVENEAYDYRYGRVSRVRDENNNRTYYTYDVFGRLAQTDYPDGGQTTTTYYDTAFPSYSVTRVKEDATHTIDSYVYVDGLGRVRQTLKVGEGTNKYIVKRVFYDNMGRVNEVRGPYFASSIGYGVDPINPNAYPWQQTAYDYRGRPTTITNPNDEYGTITSNIAYSGLTTTVTDPDLRQRATVKDYLGRTIQVMEYAPGQQNTFYDYNAAGDLKYVTNYLGNTTTMNYNSLGLKTSMTDPDMGYWQYTYDANGNLLTQTDAKSQTITFSYDELNRMRTKSYSTGEPTVNYTYDNLTPGANGRGRLASVNNTNSATTYLGYDALGRLKSVRKTIFSTNFDTQYVYDLSGKTTFTTYPDNFQVQYTYYPGTGLLREVKGVTDGRTYASYSLYEPGGATGQINYANGTATSYTYGPFSLRLTGMVTEAPDGLPAHDLQRWIYNYTRAGDLEAITNDLAGVTYTYNHDNLHRLLSETSGGVYPALNYTYNAIGNMMSKTIGSNTYTYTYDATHKHAVQNINYNGVNYAYTYDNNGNMLTGPDFTDPAQTATRTITWNADNMPTRIVWNKGTATVTTDFMYDGSGARVKKAIQSGSTTWYVGAHYEVKDGAVTKHLFASGTRIAKITAGTYRIFHQDHLGSSTVLSNSSGAKVESTEYMPFGPQRAHWDDGSPLANYKYTGQELDPETGLYYYGARYYDPAIGRFISADTIVPGPGNPQHLNRYTYADNNPLIYIDPTGNFSLGTFFESIFAGAVGTVNLFSPLSVGMA